MDTEVIEAFTKNVTADYLKKAAGRLVFGAGHPLTVYRGPGGPVAFIIKQRLLDGETPVTDLRGTVKKLLEHYKLDDYYPPVPLMREALALTVQLKRVIEKIHPDFYGVLSELVDKTDEFESPEGVYLLSYDKVQTIASEVLKD